MMMMKTIPWVLSLFCVCFACGEVYAAGNVDANTAISQFAKIFEATQISPTQSFSGDPFPTAWVVEPTECTRGVVFRIVFPGTKEYPSYFLPTEGLTGYKYAFVKEIMAGFEEGDEKSLAIIYTFRLLEDAKKMILAGKLDKMTTTKDHLGALCDPEVMRSIIEQARQQQEKTAP